MTTTYEIIVAGRCVGRAALHKYNVIDSDLRITAIFEGGPNCGLSKEDIGGILPERVWINDRPYSIVLEPVD